MDQQPAPQVAPAGPTTPLQPPANDFQPSLGVPTSWPGAFGLYKYSKDAVKRNLGTILILVIGSYIIEIILQTLLKNAGTLVSLLFSVAITLTLYSVFLASVRGEKVSIGESFKGITPIGFLNMLLNGFVLGVILSVSFLLLIIPFLFVLPRVILAPYFVVDRKMGPIKAISASWDASKGQSGKIWGVIGANFAMVLLMVTIIGIPFAIYFLIMYSASTALAYEFITKVQAVGDPVAPTVTAPIAPTSQSPVA